MTQTIFTPFHYRTTRKLRRILVALGVILWLGATLAVLAPIFPHILYRLSPATPQILAQNIGQTPASLPEAKVEPVKLPEYNSQLPRENYLVIPSIGVNGQIHEGSDWEELLRQGVWKVPDFPSPDKGKPLILAAHRWGYLDWSNQFRRLNSFNNLPRVKVGDKIEVVWGQRQYFYEVYQAENGEQITDYTADLILYTCQLWDSPVRVFRYARRVN